MRSVGENARGVYNGVGPQPVTNYDLEKAIGAAKNKKFLYLPVPPLALRIAMGEMADVVLTSTRIIPEKAMSEGFEFSFPNLESSLNAIYDRG